MEKKRLWMEGKGAQVGKATAGHELSGTGERLVIEEVMVTTMQ